MKIKTKNSEDQIWPRGLTKVKSIFWSIVLSIKKETIRKTNQ